MARPFVGAIPLGRIPVLPSLLSMVLERTREVLTSAQAKVRSVDAVLTKRIADLAVALKDPQPAVKAAGGSP